MGKATIERDGKYAEAINKLDEAFPGIKDETIKGKGVDRKVAAEAAEVVSEDPEKAKEIVSKKSKSKSQSLDQNKIKAIIQDIIDTANKYNVSRRNRRVLSEIAGKYNITPGYAEHFVKYKEAVDEFPDLEGLPLKKAITEAQRRRSDQKNEAFIEEVGSGGFSKKEEEDARVVENVYLQVDKLYSEITQGSDAVENWYTWWSKYRDIRRVEGFVLRLRQLSDEVESIIKKKGAENGDEATT